MYTAARAMFFRCLSGLHAGSGTDLGVVDLPIQRERHTGFPKVESSGVKGCLRETFDEVKGLPKDFVKVVFGPEEGVGQETKHSGAVAFTDARILLFPVRSARGVFAYTTCPLVLARLTEDLKLAGIHLPIEICKTDKALVTSSRLIIPNSNKVVLEEYTYVVEENDKVKAIAKNIASWLGKEEDEYLLNNFILLPDDEFTDFVQNATEIITRIRINSDTGTVDDRALFTEELLPTETVMYCLAMAGSAFLSEEDRRTSPTIEMANKTGNNEGTYIIKTLQEKMPRYLQMGGNATIGKGLIEVSLEKGDEKSGEC